MFNQCPAPAHAQYTFVLPIGVGGLRLLCRLDRKKLGLVGQAADRKGRSQRKGLL